MKQTIYTGHVRSHYVPKNKLQEAVSNYLDTLDGKAFAIDQYLHKRFEIADKIAELNKQHPRAMPINISWHKVVEPTGKAIFYLHGIQAIDFCFITGELEL